MKPTLLKQVAAVVAKDIRRELRTKEIVSTTLVFSLVLVLICAFAFYRQGRESAYVFPGILWVSVLFVGTLAFARTFAAERDSGCLRALALIPGTDISLYYGKFATNFLFVALFEIVLVPLLLLLFDVTLAAGAGALVSLIAVTTLGFTALGTLVAAMLVHSHIRDALLPILLFSLVAPIVILAVKGTVAVVEGGDPWSWTMWVFVLDLVFVAAAQTGFRWILSAVE